MNHGFGMLCGSLNLYSYMRWFMTVSGYMIQTRNSLAIMSDRGKKAMNFCCTFYRSLLFNNSFHFLEVVSNVGVRNRASKVLNWIHGVVALFQHTIAVIGSQLFEDKLGMLHVWLLILRGDQDVVYIDDGKRFSQGTKTCIHDCLERGESIGKRESTGKIVCKHRSSAGEWGAHNPQVHGSKPCGATTFSPEKLDRRNICPSLFELDLVSPCISTGASQEPSEAERVCLWSKWG